MKPIPILGLTLYGYKNRSIYLVQTLIVKSISKNNNLFQTYMKYVYYVYSFFNDTPKIINIPYIYSMSYFFQIASYFYGNTQQKWSKPKLNVLK